MSERPPRREPSGEVDDDRRRLLRWLWRLPVLATLGAAGVGVYEAYRIHFAKDRPDPQPTFEPLEPVAIAPLSLLDAPWEAVAFTVGTIPALALRLPEAIPGGLSLNGGHYAAFSRVCTHLGCIVELNRDLDAIAFAFNHDARQPELVCHCHLSVFSPLQAGEAVSGPAVKPLPRLELAVRQETLYAVGIERRAAPPRD